MNTNDFVKILKKIAFMLELMNENQFKIKAYNHDEALKKEYINYMWKKKGDAILDEPVKAWDDIMDAVRYAIYQIKDLYYAGNSPLISF